MSVVRFCNVTAERKLWPLSLWSTKKIRIDEKTNTTGNIPLMTLLTHPVIQREYQAVYDSERPDIVFLDLGYGFQNTYQYYLLALAARRKFGWSPILIAPYYEDTKLSDLRYLDRTFSSEPPNSKNITLGMGMPWILFLRRIECQRLPKSEFCNYVYSNDAIPSTAVRRAFCKLLMRYKRIDCPGRSLSNAPTTFTVGERGDGASKIPFMKHYKFSIAFEHGSVPGYVTEKIIQPLEAGSIPIYWGCPNIARYFNSDAFINCHEYQNFEQVVERVIAVDNDPDLYARMLNAPPTIPGNYYHDLVTKMRLEWQKLIAESLERRQKRKGWLYHHTRLGWMMLSNLHHEIDHLMGVLTPDFKAMMKRASRQD